MSCRILIFVCPIFLWPQSEWIEAAGYDAIVIKGKENTLLARVFICPFLQAPFHTAPLVAKAVC